MPLAPDAFIAELWGIANQIPMIKHPWFAGIIEHRWTREQIVQGEVQHYLRVRTNPIFFGYIAVNAVQEKNYGLMEVVLENFMEELGGERTHVDIMLQFLEEAGITREEADRADPAPGTMAAIEMIVGGCQRRSALEGLALDLRGTLGPEDRIERYHHSDDHAGQGERHEDRKPDGHLGTPSFETKALLIAISIAYQSGFSNAR